MNLTLGAPCFVHSLSAYFVFSILPIFLKEGPRLYKLHASQNLDPLCDYLGKEARGLVKCSPALLKDVKLLCFGHEDMGKGLSSVERGINF